MKTLIFGVLIVLMSWNTNAGSLSQIEREPLGGSLVIILDGFTDQSLDFNQCFSNQLLFERENVRMVISDASGTTIHHQAITAQVTTISGLSFSQGVYKATLITEECREEQTLNINQ